MSTLVAVAASLGAAAAFAAATVLQARGADAVVEVESMRPRHIAVFLRATVAHPLYLFGLIGDGVGLALHAVALHAGALAVVQPLMVTGVLFTLPLYHRLAGRHVGRRELGWAVVLTVGLVGFLVAASPPNGVRPSVGEAVGQVDREPAVVSAVLAVVAALACVVLARRSSAGSAARRSGHRPSSVTSAALLGLAAGLAFAGTAAFIKSSTDVLARNPFGLLTAGSFYGLVAVGAVGLVLHQLAFQAGPLTASLPAFTVVDPLVSVALGVLVYHEQLRASPVALIVQVLCLCLMSGGAIILTRADPGADAPTAVGGGADEAGTAI